MTNLEALRTLDADKLVYVLQYFFNANEVQADSFRIWLEEEVSND